ncbi:MAG: ArsR family transcriptional regulator [Candidatus Hadarchaeales archaeon]
MANDIKEELYVDVLQMMPNEISGRKVVAEDIGGKVVLYLPPPKNFGGGRESKKITINRRVLLDSLFFEGLGLWQGEGGKGKGIYFCNSNPQILCHFLTFVEKRLGLSRIGFKVTVCTSSSDEHDSIKEKWSKVLGIPLNNFTTVSVDVRINKDNVQVYLNSVILVELLKNMHEKLKPVITSNIKFAAAYLRGVFAGEGCVLLRKSGVLFHVDFATKDESSVRFYKQCLDFLGISHGKYMRRSLKFPIHGYRNLKRFKELSIHALHPEKREKFERGFSAYRRTNVLDGEEARRMILEQLASGPKTYDELAAALGKARTTIQAHHIPILEKQGLVKRAGKKGQAWMWSLCSL